MRTTKEAFFIFPVPLFAPIEALLYHWQGRHTYCRIAMLFDPPIAAGTMRTVTRVRLAPRELGAEAAAALCNWLDAGTRLSC